MSEHECRVYLEHLHYLVKMQSREAFQHAWKNLDYMEARSISKFGLAQHMGLVERFTLSGHSDHMSRSLSNGQIESKLWLVSTLLNVLPAQPYRIAIIGGWTGLLSNLIFWRMPNLVAQITQIEIDPEAQWIAKQFLDDARTHDKFCQVTQDANGYDFSLNHHLIINCSTEHFADNTWFSNIPKSRFVALQSTDNTKEPTHVNCVFEMKDFRIRYPLEMTLYHGYTDLPDYRRYMRIGRI